MEEMTKTRKLAEKINALLDQEGSGYTATSDVLSLDEDTYGVMVLDDEGDELRVTVDQER